MPWPHAAQQETKAPFIYLKDWQDLPALLDMLQNRTAKDLESHRSVTCFARAAERPLRCSAFAGDAIPP